MRKNTSTAIALIFAATTVPAFAQATYTFSDVDADGNLELSSSEFARVSKDAFARWDANANQQIEEDEFTGGIFSDWDADADGMLTEQEYDAGWTAWFSGEELVAYSDFDGDKDGALSEEEFGAGLQNTGVYDDWDTASDGFLDEEEFSVGLYDRYDADRNEIVAEAEYEAFERVDTAAAGVGGADNTLQANIVDLNEWRYDDLYAGGVSVEEVLDADVVGPTGEEIGDVENVLIDRDGKLLSAVVEVGGFLEIGDTHVNVPWDQLEVSADGETVEIPLTQETIEEYSLFTDPVLGAAEAASDIQAVEGDNVGVVLTGPRVWRASELIGDYARLQDGGNWVNYGYVDDLIIRDGSIAAVLVDPDSSWGEPGPYAYPYYGYDQGWYPGLANYDLPYDRTQTGSLEPFEEDRLDD